MLLRLITPAVLLLSGCSWNWNPLPDESYSRTDRLAAGASVGCAVADDLSTFAALDRGARELNPILGEHPSDGKIVALTVLGQYLTHVIAKNMPEKGRKWWLGILGAGQCAIAAHNTTVN